MTRLRQDLDKTMKQSIIRLIESRSASVVLRRGIELRRWTINALGDKVDKLEVRIDLADYNYHDCHEIVSRDYDGVITETINFIRASFCRTGECVSLDIVNGYWGVIA